MVESWGTGTRLWIQNVTTINKYNIQMINYQYNGK